ncbi:ABC transporter substrate-binding protein [Promethearchaeum syntrophicum]|uniref:ABC transporter substrate-binding protein n=1 Tax=Promethearchaeum syntrophicum TaxID=2594042 RepID=A0A5B9D9U6_9ARCH|nr:ABC transporter substrate-binding protein [Candidatus Prometheoarchaeum syntrophicum]QEE15914.1 cystine transporter subunit [Candidatus Prometheoarchaeum syntrophicum]
MKNKPHGILILFIFLLPFLFFFVSDSSATPIEDSSLQDVIDAGKIVVGIDVGYPPFEQINSVTDEIEGFDPDIMQYIANDIGVSIEWVDVYWTNIFADLQNGEFDCAISAITITPERESEMDFSRWYYRSALAIMVNDDNPKGIESIADINSTLVSVGVQDGTAGESYIDDEGIVAEKVRFSTITLAIEALKYGTVDVVLGNFAVLSEIKEEDSELLFIKDVFKEDEFGIPVQTGSDTLRLRINSILDEMLGENLIHPTPNVYYTGSHEEWFGRNPYLDFRGDFIYYTINTSSSNNGIIDPEGEISVLEGDDRFFKFIPDEGFMVDSVNIDGTIIGTPHNYTFENVDSDHTLFVEFKKGFEEDPFELPGYSIIPLILLSSTAVCIVATKIQKRKPNLL